MICGWTRPPRRQLVPAMTSCRADEFSERDYAMDYQFREPANLESSGLHCTY